MTGCRLVAEEGGDNTLPRTATSSHQYSRCTLAIMAQKTWWKGMDVAVCWWHSGVSTGEKKETKLPVSSIVNFIASRPGVMFQKLTYQKQSHVILLEHSPHQHRLCVTLNWPEQTYLRVKFCRSLCFKAHLDHEITKARKGLSSMKVMAAAGIEQRWLVPL